MTGLDPRALRDAFGAFMTGVTVVTAHDSDGNPIGFTANSFSSVSLDPPLVSVCLANSSSNYDALANASGFAVNVLSEMQKDVSNTFANYKGDRFSKVGVTPDAHGIAMIDGAAAQFSCRTSQVIQAGDHILLVGEVDAFQRSQVRGLGYAGGQYFSLGMERAAALTNGIAQQAFAGTILRYGDSILLAETPQGFVPPTITLPGGVSAMDALNDYWWNSTMDVELDQAYSIFDDRDIGERHTYFLAQAANDVSAELGHYVPIANLPNMPFPTSALKTMFTRYALEVQSSSFGLYVGHESSGEVHHFQKGK